MEDYTASLNREINGKAITVDDIKYFAKIEHQQNGKRIVKGIKKDGNQSHIHTIASRKDASNSGEYSARIKTQRFGS